MRTLEFAYAILQVQKPVGIVFHFPTFNLIGYLAENLRNDIGELFLLVFHGTFNPVELNRDNPHK
jgi:hypothetical protein